MTDADLHHAIDALNARNARVTRRAEAAADLIIVMVVGILLGLALVHWATCEGVC